MSPSEEQKVKMAILLLVLFLTGFSLATGALEVGTVDGHGVHVSAYDIKGSRRFRLLLSYRTRPDLAFFNGSGERWSPNSQSVISGL